MSAWQQAWRIAEPFVWGIGFGSAICLSWGWLIGAACEAKFEELDEREERKERADELQQLELERARLQVEQLKRAR